MADVDPHFTDVFASLPLATIACDRHGCIRAWNPAAATLFGLEADAAIGSSFMDVLGVEASKLLALPRAPERTCLRLRTGSEVALDVDVLIAPIRVGAECIGYHLFFRDRGQFLELESDLQESLARYRQLVDHAEGFAFFGTDPRGRIDVWNRGAERVLGYTEQEVLGSSISIIYTEEDRANGQDIQEMSMAATQGAARDERWHVRKDGTRFWANGILTSINDEFGHRVGFVKALRDDTPRRLAEERLAEERQRLSLVLESLAEGVIATDVLGHVTLMNREAEALTGWSRTETEGRPVSEVFVVEPNHEDGSGHSVRVLDATLRRRDGEEIPISYSRAAMPRSGDLASGEVIVVSDARAQRRAEQRLVRAEKLAALGVLAGGMAHQFNNILTGLFGNLSLARHLLDPHHPAADSIASAEQSFQRAHDLTQRFLTFAEGGRPIKRRGSVGSVLQETAEFVSAGTQTTIETRIDPTLWTVEFDPQQLRQAAISVLLNAYEATAAAGSTQPIELIAHNEDVIAEHGYSVTGRHVIIRIIDHGPGMPQDMTSKIFDPFFSTKPGHVGLGLATAYSIVRAHHGHISARSQPGAGTEIHICLPAAA